MDSVLKAGSWSDPQIDLNVSDDKVRDDTSFRGSLGLMATSFCSKRMTPEAHENNWLDGY